ncbi:MULTISPECIES: hypothetical protein [Rhodopirellula]|jgi:hypothetical protein|uniref:Uncharacterized protein n=1 Tax=Rhodopirellula europaea SH398 TaxID=1263868 RepID=M5RZQ0_9BACT|nr:MULTISPECIES: hypothetical protein [Rhodopirellula]EMI24818.1 hypothetical protein RESH_04604 [Rhodopirellula europaea SH398]MCR9208440.1 hypothetical protein [bacterium]|tara:strand:+ start:580 stop:741 length:162 start_codon:yes stop_codon:yes gene_type:complete
MSEKNDEQVAAILARGIARVRAIETDDDRDVDDRTDCNGRSEVKNDKRSEVTQ